jgi:hypothetical protein
VSPLDFLGGSVAVPDLPYCLLHKGPPRDPSKTLRLAVIAARPHGQTPNPADCLTRSCIPVSIPCHCESHARGFAVRGGRAKRVPACGARHFRFESPYDGPNRALFGRPSCRLMEGVARYATHAGTLVGRRRTALPRQGEHGVEMIRHDDRALDSMHGCCRVVASHSPATIWPRGDSCTVL